MSKRNGAGRRELAEATSLRSDATRNRQLLLDAAAEVFAEQGLEGSVVDVARIAGLGVGTLYRHFPNKEALVDELVRELLSDLLSDARAAAAEPDGRGLERFLYALGEQQSSRYGCLPRLWSSAQHEDLMSAIRAEATALLADAQQHGQVLADLAPSDVFAIMWSLRGLIETTRGVAPDMWRRHLEIILRGLAPSPEPLTHKPPTKASVARVVATLTAKPVAD